MREQTHFPFPALCAIKCESRKSCRKCYLASSSPVGHFITPDPSLEIVGSGWLPLHTESHQCSPHVQPGPARCGVPSSHLIPGQYDLLQTSAQSRYLILDCAIWLSCPCHSQSRRCLVTFHLAFNLRKTSVYFLSIHLQLPTSSCRALAIPTVARCCSLSALPSNPFLFGCYSRPHTGLSFFFLFTNTKQASIARISTT